MAKRLTKKEIEAKKEDAYIFYMAGLTYAEIMERTGIKSNKTIGDWVSQGGWKEKRAAQTVSRPELINKILLKINNKLDEEDFNADEMAKMAATIERLDKKNNPVVIMEVLIGFGRYLSKTIEHDKELDIEFIKKVNSYQDAYVSFKMNGNE